MSEAEAVVGCGEDGECESRRDDEEYSRSFEEEQRGVAPCGPAEAIAGSIEDIDSPGRMVFMGSVCRVPDGKKNAPPVNG